MNYFYAPIEVCGCGCGRKFYKLTCGMWSVRDEKLLCAECAGVPKLAAHKYAAIDINYKK